MPTDYQFTGQRKEAGFGLYDYNARYYDPLIGRFVSADSVVPGAGNPQALNRYGYELNNPVKYTDPTGHDPEDNKECQNIANCLPEDPPPDCARNTKCAYEYTEKQIATLRGRFHPKLRAIREGLEHYRDILAPHKDTIEREGTFSIGITASAGGAGYGGSLTLEAVIDTHGNFDIQFSPAGGAMIGLGASAGFVAKVTNAPTVDDLVTNDRYGMASSTGGSAGEGLIVGMDYIQQNEGKIRGIEWSLGVGAEAPFPVPAEAHVYMGPTVSWWRSWFK
jgi:RHS repeat-associated protein